MIPCLAYRQFHEQTNTAAAAVVLLAEFGLIAPPEAKSGQELTLHGLVQRGVYDGGRGLVLHHMLGYFSDFGLQYTVLHDAARTAALQNHVRRWLPDFEFRVFQDLREQGATWESLDAVFADEARLLLVEARHSIRDFRTHVLLARRAGHLHVMNPETGRDHICNRRAFASHLASPVSAGAVSFAGSQYLYTGVAIRVWKQTA